MVRINKVYTKKGDKGETSLAYGGKIGKDHPRVRAYGTVDELNSLVGIVRCFNLEKPESIRRDKLETILQAIQQRLFDIGSVLATDAKSAPKSKPSVTEANVAWLEEVIDAMNEELTPLNSFVLPGGSPVNAFLHQCRTVCRRAERDIVSLSRDEEIDSNLMAYINRLSDALFVFSRWTASTMNEKEFLWEPGQDDPDDWRWSR
ncbi:MAG: cob(I)yrinic acid a,c-diamide adenosyltransferase [Nitrospinaceae bacterium]|nr:MAG: cob(I)yrinic acid a,c-diamide adenosyltransferase [Nitrospinaceae bacterium]